MFAVRQAEPEDAEAACEVLRRSIVECCTADHGGNREIIGRWIANKTPEAVRSWIRSPGYCIVAERDGTIAGIAMLDAGGIVALCYLVPEARHRGVGKAMLRALEAEAVARGLSEISLSSTGTAHAFYRRNGYAEVETVDSGYGFTSIRMRRTMEPDSHPHVGPE